MKTIENHIHNNGLKKEWIAIQLGITRSQLYNLIKSPQALKRDKLKVEKLCQIFDCTVDEIDFDNI